MFKRSVEVSFGFEQRYVLEVGVVDVGIDSEKSLEDGFDGLLEITWEFDADLRGKDIFVMDLVFDSTHQVVDVLAGADF